MVGEDFPADDRAKMTGAGIDLLGLQTAPGRTFRWAGRYGKDPNDRTTLDTQLNVFAGFEPKLPDSYRTYLTRHNDELVLNARKLKLAAQQLQKQTPAGTSAPASV